MINAPAVFVERRGAVTLVRVRTFSTAENDAVPRTVERAVKDAIKAGARGFVLDLRNNSGGAMDDVVHLTDLFMDGGEIGSGAPAQLCGGGGPPWRYAARRGDVAKQLPLIVLVNRHTGSGAEFAAAALQNAGRARIVGEPTAKRGVLQTYVPRANRFAIRLHTGDLIMADGRPLQGVGVTPDIETPPKDIHGDPPLARALELLSAQ
jgi:carboxyl-terminal processing protease